MMGKSVTWESVNSSTYGYFKHGVGAKYISPLVTGTLFPELVEIHESLHAQLSSANRIDIVASIFSQFYDPSTLKGGLLEEKYFKDVRKLIEAIHKNTVYTHEVVATYLSFLAFYVGFPNQDYLNARKQLPSFYKNVLKDCENTFGSVTTVRKSINIFQMVMACAMVAMNIPFFPIDVRIDSLKEFVKKIENESPDKRFKKILHNIRTNNKIRGVFQGLLLSNDLGFATIYEVFRTFYPQLKFTSLEHDSVFPDHIRRLLEHDLLHLGYEFNNHGENIVDDKKDDRDLSEDRMEDHFEAKIDLPGLAEYFPVDLSLILWEYVQGTLDELIAHGKKADQKGLCIFITVITSPDYKIVDLACLLNTQGKKDFDFDPINVTCSYTDFIRTMSSMPKSIILKVDERWFSYMKPDLLKTGQWIVVLIHDTRSKHFCAYLENMGKKQPVKFKGYQLLDNNFYCLVGYAVTDRYFVITPATRLGIQYFAHQVQENRNFQVFTSEIELEVLSGIERINLRDLLSHCYVDHTSEEFRKKFPGH